jgi:hypothetical protein
MSGDDPYRSAREALEARVLDGPGHTDPALRRAAARGLGLPPELEAYVDTVRRHAFHVTDEQVDALRRLGYGEDQLFEITASAAVGAAGQRLEAGLRALEEADAAEEG